MLMVRPCVEKLSAVNNVGGLRCPVSLRVTCSSNAALHPYNSAANSASDANYMTCLMVEDKVSTVPFLNCLFNALVK